MNKTLARKSIFTAVLVACILAVMGFAAQHVYAADTVYTEGYLKYTISNESITIIEYFGSDKTVTVPNQIAGIPVNVIGKGAFDGTPATKVKLPDTITTVSEGAIGSGVTVVYNSNTSKPDTVKPDAGADKNEADKKEENKKEQTVTINKGQTVTIKKKTYTVTKGVTGSTLKGAELEDEKGNKYTVNSKGELVDEDGEVIGDIPEDSYTSITSGDVASDEADITLDDEESTGPSGFALAIGGIIVVLIAALLIVLKKLGIIGKK